MPSRWRCGKAFTSSACRRPGFAARPAAAFAAALVAPPASGAAAARRRPLEQHDAVAPVLLREQHLHDLVPRGGEGLAHVVGADGQLAMAAVHQHRQLDARGPAEVDQLVEGARTVRPV